MKAMIAIVFSFLSIVHAGDFGIGGGPKVGEKSYLQEDLIGHSEHASDQYAIMIFQLTDYGKTMVINKEDDSKDKIEKKLKLSLLKSSYVARPGEIKERMDGQEFYIFKTKKHSKNFKKVELKGVINFYYYDSKGKRRGINVDDIDEFILKSSQKSSKRPQVMGQLIKIITKKRKVISASRIYALKIEFQAR